MNDNKLKSINGLMCKNDLTTIMKNLQEKGVVVFCTSDYRCGYPECSEKQFYAPFYIEFRNGASWIIFSTNSIRNDRMNIQQWNAENIKKINPSVTKAYVVVPNEVKKIDRESKEVYRYNEKIDSKAIFSMIDKVLFQSELEDMIQAYANRD